MKEAKRLIFLDNLKALLILLVVFHHVGQAYGPTGGYWDVQDASRWNLLGPFFAVNASFFMALFFFVSAFFFAPSYDKKGFGAFLRDKLVRLGIPVLLGLVVIVPLYQYFSFINYRGGAPMSFFAYFTDIFLGMGDKPDLLNSPNWPELNYGPFWFILHLLIYSVLYAVFRKIAALFHKNANAAKTATAITRAKLLIGILILVAAVSALTVLIRTEFAIDDWEGLFGFIQMEPAHFPVYFGMLVAGLLARRYGLLEKLRSQDGFIIFALGIAMALTVYVARVITGAYPPWLSGIYPVYEPVMGISLCIGFVTLARETINKDGKVWRLLSQNAFGVYIIHVPVVILCQAAILDLSFSGVLKFFIAGICAYLICNIIIFVLRKLKPVRRVIG